MTKLNSFDKTKLTLLNGFLGVKQNSCFCFFGAEGSSSYTIMNQSSQDKLLMINNKLILAS